MGYIQINNGADFPLIDCADVLDFSVAISGEADQALTIRYRFNMGSNKLLKCVVTYMPDEEVALAMDGAQIRAAWAPLITRMATEPGVVDAPVVLKADNTVAQPSVLYGLTAALT